MEKPITLTLTESEYKKLMELFHLGYMIEDTITEKTKQRMLEEIDFMEKLSRQAYESGSKNVFTEGKMYGITPEMEEHMLECFEEFKEYINSGQDAEQDKIIEQQIEEMLKQEKKQSRKGK
jgi:hypothetical protein